MKYDDGSDPYIDPATGLLRNLVDARSQGELDRAEALFSAIRAIEIQQASPEDVFDLVQLCTVHRKLFGDVYPWAGEVRTVDIAKGNTLFAKPHYIENEGKRIFSKLAQDKYLRGLAPNEFSKRAAEVLGDINALHPFREGNGRTQRAFLGQLAKAAGYIIAWENVTQVAMTQASIAAMGGNNAGLEVLIHTNLMDIDQRAAIVLGKLLRGKNANVLFPELGKTYNGRLIGVTDRYLVQGQRRAGGAFVLHRRDAVTGDAAGLRDKIVTVSYPEDGNAKIKRASRGKDMGL